jgi:hypothetical protein
VLVLDTEQGAASALGPVGVSQIQSYLKRQLFAPAHASAR